MSLRSEVDAEYRPFPNAPARNGLHAALEVPMLVRALALPRGGRVLEVGCGQGIALPVLARLLRPTRLVGVDVDRALLADAARGATAARAELVHADVRALPFADATFDLVIDFGTCYHIARPDRALGEIARVLRPRGLFVHETPLAQLLAHPVRSRGRRLPWGAVPHLRRERAAVLWSLRRRTIEPEWEAAASAGAY
jgi:ubiquinone/menaquinone biosynthesis C-methylase UbiE